MSDTDGLHKCVTCGRGYTKAIWAVACNFYDKMGAKEDSFDWGIFHQGTHTIKDFHKAIKGLAVTEPRQFINIDASELSAKYRVVLPDYKVEYCHDPSKDLWRSTRKSYIAESIIAGFRAGEEYSGRDAE